MFIAMPSGWQQPRVALFQKWQWPTPKMDFKDRAICNARRLKSPDYLLCERRRHISQAESLAEYANAMCF